MADENHGSFWSQLFGSRQGGTGRMQKLAAPPPPPAENWPRAAKYYGEPTPIFVLHSVASAEGWNVDRGFQMQPRELANYLLAGGHAKAAKLSDMPPTEGQ